MLKHPNWSKPLYISTDASKISISAILFQYDDENKKQIIYFACRSLTSTETRYSITELELLSIIFACKKLRMYLLIGHHKDIVRTDHKALSFLKSCRLTYWRLYRWSLILQEFNLEIQFIPGKENIPADVLSRVTDENYVSPSEEGTLKVFNNKLKLGITDREFKPIFQNISDKQSNDEKYGKIIDALKNRELTNEKIGDNFVMCNQILFQKRHQNNLTEY